ncbi:inorganic phosphate transporter [Coprinopsis sp. MPI-PUGE-AT-0042]|nr:inorganic phosphate transporter [Coprinopsis sp. MPI-PUGE-AT-0042]
MSAQIQNLVISLGVMQLAKRVPFDDPVILNYVRVAYVSVQLVILGVYYYLSTIVKQKNNQTVLKYVEQPSPMSSDEPKVVTTTVKDYDLGQVSTLLRSSYTSLAMMAVMHLYFKFTQPLFVQSIMGLKGLYDAKLVAIHLLGKPATGDLARPFKTAGMFGGADSGPATDAASIAEAEKKVAKKDN